MKCFASTAIAAAVALYTCTLGPISSHSGRTSAALASHCDGDSQHICYSWGVPESSSSSGSGNFYFRIEASIKYQWVALGTGSRMDGSDMFVVYQDGSGNVTLSTKKGHGHDMPQYSQVNGVRLLEGSGVSNNTMIANVQCGDLSGMDLTGSNSWISAWKTGSPLDSTDVGVYFNKHDGTDGFSVNFAQATISSDSNPFTNTSGIPVNSGSGSGAVSGGGSGNNDGMVKAHGIIMTIVFLIGYPTGAFLMPVVGKWLIHAGWQVLAFAVMWIGFGIGKIAANRYDQVSARVYILRCILGMLANTYQLPIKWFTEPHVQLGTIVCIMMVLQPVLGWMHHRNYLKYQRRTPVSHFHMWYGRALLIIGIVNGGIGLQLARASTGYIVAYSVIAVIAVSMYVAGAIYGEMKLRGQKKVMSPSITMDDIQAADWVRH
ncbi:Uncharacterized protein TPAR_01969 [Tolypocladium paradoxum]|uniref:DOMON domain-containing protein n=1 Tax=Tolypocladium paradoxum TaxID=94208 RepID=A0A2S4L5Z6_9HYPO|nr:Uncharacterized protein TPAR_01969 [Tolypocladium paradoxum]